MSARSEFDKVRSAVVEFLDQPWVNVIFALLALGGSLLITQGFAGRVSLPFLFLGIALALIGTFKSVHTLSKKDAQIAKHQDALKTASDEKLELLAKLDGESERTRLRVAEAVAKARSELSDNLDTVVWNLLKGLFSNWTLSRSRNFIEKVLDETAHLLPVDDCRVNLYTYEPVAGGLRPGGTDFSLVRYDYQGGRRRQHAPRKYFSDRDAHGAYLRKMANDDGYLVVPDIKAVVVTGEDGTTHVSDHKSTPVPVDCKDASYGGFLAVTVTWKNKPLGMVMVDVPQAGVLSEDHALLTRLMCQFCAAGLQAINQSQKRPELNQSNRESGPLGMTGIISRAYTGAPVDALAFEETGPPAARSNSTTDEDGEEGGDPR